MSFSVKAGGSPTQPIQNNPSYVSPSLMPQSTAAYRSSGSNAGHPPPFSLADPSQLDSSGANSGAKRVGTDPTKYKTTICRNWEQTGNCSFRGCTFAHGVEELRPHARMNTSPPLQPQHQPSPGTTPPLYPGLPPHSSPTLPLSQLPPSGPQRVEFLVEMLVTEVAKERDLVNIHVEANKTLEVMLRREQALHAEAGAQVESLMAQVGELTRLVNERNQEILRLVDAAGSRLAPEQQARALALTQWRSSQNDKFWSPEPERQAVDVSGPSSRRALPPPPPPAAQPSTLKPIDESPNSSSRPTFYGGSSTATKQQQSALDEADESKLRDLLEALRQQN